MGGTKPAKYGIGVGGSVVSSMNVCSILWLASMLMSLVLVHRFGYRPSIQAETGKNNDN